MATVSRAAARKPVRRASSPALAFQDDALLDADPATVNRTLDQMKAAGARNLRVNAIWGQVRKNGAYDWGKLDTLANAARARGIAPQMTLMGTPEYMRARNLDMGLSAGTPNQNLMAAFARDAATHFKGRVGRYSIWNEPNIASFLAEGENPGKAGAQQYRRLYQSGYKGVKSVDPHAQVLLGELTAGRQGSPGYTQALGFLRRVLGAGSKPLLADGLALHPYQWSDPNQKMHDANYGGISNLPMVQKELEREFRRGKLATGRKTKVPLYLTEFGYKTSQMNAATRAAYLQRAYQLAKQAGAREFLQYQWLPTQTTAMQPQNAVQVQGNATLAPNYGGGMRQVPGQMFSVQPPPKAIVTQGGPWDTSVANSFGQLDPRMATALRRIKRMSRGA